MTQPTLESKMSRGVIDLGDIAGAADKSRECMVELLGSGDHLSAAAKETISEALEELDAVVTALSEWLGPTPVHAMTLH
jgi:hypothetical protein